MITPGLSHPPQFLFGVGFGSAFLYMSLTGYEKGLNVLSLWRTYEYLKRRAPFKLPSKNNPLLIWHQVVSIRHTFSPPVFSLFFQVKLHPVTAQHHGPKPRKAWSLDEELKTPAEHHHCVLDSLNYGHVHRRISIWILVLGLFLSLGIYHTSVFTSVARRVDLMTKYSLRSFGLKQNWSRITKYSFHELTFL